MKLSEVLAAREPLNKLSQKHFSNFKVVREISCLIKAVNEEVDFFNSEFNKLVIEYSEKDANGKPVIVQGNNIKLKDDNAKQAFNDDYKKLVELDVSDKVKVITITETDFKPGEELLTPNEMMILDPLINWGEDSEEAKQA